MSRARSASLLLAILAASFMPAIAGGNVNAILGARIMDEEDWEPVDNPPALGVNGDFGLFGWPVNIAVGLHYSSAKDTLRFGSNRADVTETMYDLSAGVTRAWKVAGNIHPYVGGGIAWVKAKREVDQAGSPGAEGDDSSAALYIDWGVYWRMSESFNLGLGARFVGLTDMTFDYDGSERDINADYFQAGLLLGWGTPD